MKRCSAADHHLVQSAGVASANKHAGKGVSVGALEIKRLTRENRELKKYFESVAVVVAQSIAALDAEMKMPSSNERGKRIAAACNHLEMVNDSLMHFGLKFEFKKIKKLKTQWDKFKVARAANESNSHAG